jgi:alpha-ribazole phosphatase
MNAIILLLRHGETALNREGTLRGHLDVPLTEHGRAEAEALARRVASEYTIARIYCSPLQRALETAAPIAARCGLEVKPDPAFIDIDYGGWAGRSTDEMTPEEARRFREWERDPSVPLPGAEPPSVVQERVLRALVERAVDGEVAAIVSHDAVLQLALAGLAVLPLAGYRSLLQHTATLNEVVFLGDAWQVTRFNSLGHLADLEPGREAHAMRRPRLRETSAGGVVFHDGRVLALQLPNGDWVLPKGHLEEGESPEQAAVREVLEEAGVAAEVTAPLNVNSYAVPYGDRHSEKSVYWFSMRARERLLRPAAGEFRDAQWMTPEQALNRLAWREQREAARTAVTMLGLEPRGEPTSDVGVQ